ncbi:MAG TPA: hypothetical protein VLA93_06660 [Pyrinomonadaceae bacterium]|nr:hypothetical protein [Pyrinomonadaceae bacterium]
MRSSAILFVVLLGASFLPLTKHAESSTVTPTTPFDEYGNICWEQEQARLDNFAIQLQHDQELIAYIVVYAGRISCREEATYRGNRARDYVVKRGLDSKRVIFKDGGFRLDLQTVLHLQPRSKPDYEVHPTLSKDKASIKRCIDKVFAKVLCLNNQ